MEKRRRPDSQVAIKFRDTIRATPSTTATSELSGEDPPMSPGWAGLVARCGNTTAAGHPPRAAHAWFHKKDRAQAGKVGAQTPARWHPFAAEPIWGQANAWLPVAPDRSR
ncbi:hypothetical protein OHV05_35970 (plasmid) [Kitasatospora sp. NBC_00070]|uniref:hypothetical protein n=1 Tax=Kitasatospora sp. NBC_00070 TaxID=2975962 RepID=UPI002F9150D2